MLLLVDMDGVIADFERGLSEGFREQFPTETYIPLDQIRTFYVEESYPRRLRKPIRKIYHSEGFFANLHPIDGALEALHELQGRDDTDVFICTTPIRSSPFSAQEKLEWVINHLDDKWAKRLILTGDKTLVRGDVLIDDKPEIKGILTPTWEHVLFDQPYNRDVTSKRRLTWNNWREVLDS